MIRRSTTLAGLTKCDQVASFAVDLNRAQAEGIHDAEQGRVLARYLGTTVASKKSRTALEYAMDRIVYGMSDCWFWRGHIDKNYGYGMSHFKDKRQRAHRFVWEIWNGKIPPNGCVLHSCDVRNCVNPDHLWIGSRADNNRDCNEKGRRPAPRGMRSGAAVLTDESVHQLRRMRLETGLSYSKLAAHFGVTNMTAFNAITGRSWSHIQ